ncbi:MAG: D-alanine--D-alanine ligase [Lactobacillaceae bacterium]|jgi:D-alanine-D-alanine ligase|nr:D-alanine--D-alanine ligase [Lactobacillaceae bacterium]
MMKKVMVVMGGMSSEREVSLVTGKGAAQALKNSGYEVYEYDLKNGHKFSKELIKIKPDVVFNALHGTFGEDGSIQGFLDILQIPYTHSGVNASAIGMNKQVTKEVAVSLGINVAESQKMTFKKFKEKGTRIELPYVIKPVSEGSSVGVFIIKTEKDLKHVNYADENQDILIEKFIDGKEITCAVINGKAHVVTELVASKEFYNYEAKYTDGLTEHILPAPLPDDVTNIVMSYSERIHNALDCNTVSRSDLRYNETDGVVFLEINTNPGLTPLSLVPEQAAYIGMSYEELCKTLVENASCKKI